MGNENLKRNMKWNHLIGGILIGLIIGLVIGISVGYYALKSPTSTSLFTGTIKIGYAESLTGAEATEGQEGLDGLTMAVEQINAAGGVLGNKLTIVTGDCGDRSPITVNSVFQKLIYQDKVDVILTGVASNTNFEVEICNDSGMPYIISGSSAQTNSYIGNNGTEWPYVWSFAPLYTAYLTIPDYIDQWQSQGYLNLPTKTVAMIESDNPYSNYISSGLKPVFKADGWNVTVDQVVPLETISDWSSILAQIRAAKPDLIINTDYQYTNEAAFLQQFLESPTNSIMFLQYAPSTPQFINLTGTASNGVIYDFPWLTTTLVPLYEQLQTNFTQRWGYAPGTYGHMLYWEAYAYAAAVKAAGGYTDKLKVANAIGQEVLTTSLGTIKLDPQTHLAQVGENYMPPTYYQIWNGTALLLNTQFKQINFTTPPWFH